MTQTEQPEKKSDYSDPLPPNAENTDGPSAPKQEKIACRNIENAKQFWRHWVARPIACIVPWIDKHDGVVTAAATVAIAFLTWSLSQDSRRQADTANDQFNIMRGQLDEMRFEQRPWIYADIGPGGRISRDQSGGLTFPIAFKVHNTGHLPATYVSPDIDGYLSGEGGVVGSMAVRGRQRKRCGLQLQQPNASDQIGVTVFPGQSVLLGANIWITADKIGEVRELEHKIGELSDFFPTPWGAGCIRYRSPDGAFHQTGIAFIVSMGKPGKEGAYALPIDPTSIDPQSLIIESWIEGGTAYAN
jgi:hypothetical protein